VHGAEFTNYPSKGDYLIRVQLRCDDPSQLSKVTKVAYHLHHSYHNRIRERTTAADNFELQFNAFGQFHLRAEVYFKDVEESLTLWRYLNF
jgi:transcription initiation factor IIF auxiliary subunit